MIQRIDRRALLKAGTLLAGTGVSAGFSPLLLAQAAEDPVAIIESFAREIFKVFGPLNGVSESYASRRQLLQEIVNDRFAYDEMAEAAAAIALPEMTDAERRRLSAVGRDLVAEYLLFFFVNIQPENQFVVNGLRRSRSGNRLMIDTTVILEDGSKFSIIWHIVERDGRYLVYDVRSIVFSVMNQVTDLATEGYETAGMYMLFRVLDRRIESYRQKFPD